MSEELIREVDEEVKRDRLQEQVKRYGPLILLAVVLVVGAAAAGAWWVGFQERQKQAFGDQFQAATVLAAEGRLDEALDAFETLAVEADAGYQVLAKMRQASLLVQFGDNEAAATIYDEIADARGVDQHYRDMAVILGALHTLDDADPQALTDRLTPLTSDDNPWRFSARELSALLAMRLGDQDQAGSLLRSLTEDLGAPPAMRARAAELLAALGQ